MGYIFAGTLSNGVILSSDAGVSWDLVNEGLINKKIRALLIDQYDFLYAGTEGGGVFKSKSSTTLINREVFSNHTISVTLFQNYPNPFNPATTISYLVPSSAYTSLKVYDILGNEVASLINEEKPAGNYHLIFNSAELSSGTYFYKLQAGSFSETKKMVLIK